MSPAATRPRYSGHETFACRFGWLPKAVRLIERDPAAMSSDDEAIVQLGLGKNMVKSLRFWLDAFDVADARGGNWSLRPFGAALFGRLGTDPFIERVETQWLLHWALCARATAPLSAWRLVFHRRMRSDFTRGELVSELQRESAREGGDLSDVTLGQHVDALLHTYMPTNALAAPEDVLDGPLVDLRLVRSEGRRRSGPTRSEPVYSLARTPANRIAGKVVDYAIESFWAERRPGERTVSFRDLAHAEGSPGTTLRLREDDLREHLDRPGRPYSFRASGDSGAITRADRPEPSARLQEIYA